MVSVSEGIEDLGLRLAVQNKSAVVFSNRVQKTSPKIRLSGESEVMSFKFEKKGLRSVRRVMEASGPEDRFV